MLFKATKAIAFTNDAAKSVAFIQINPRTEVSEITLAFTDALPTAGKFGIYVLKDGGDWTNAAHYVLAGTLAAPGSISLAGVRGVQIYGFGASGAGTVNLTVIAERRYQ